MSEPAARGVTSERDVLLGGKLNVPGLRPDLVPRPRLAQRLDEGQGRGLAIAMDAAPPDGHRVLAASADPRRIGYALGR